MPLIGFAKQEDFDRVKRTVIRSENDGSAGGGRQGRWPVPTPQGLVGKWDSNVAQGNFGTVSIYSAVAPDDWTDLQDTNHNEQALCLTSDGVGGKWVILVPTAAGYVVVEDTSTITRTFIGKTDAQITKGASGTVSIWSGSTIGSESDTGSNQTGVYCRYATVASGKWVRCEYNEDSNAYEIVAAEC